MGQVWLEGKWHGTSRNGFNEDEFQMTAVQQLTTLSHSMMSLMRCFTLHCVSQVVQSHGPSFTRKSSCPQVIYYDLYGPLCVRNTSGYSRALHPCHSNSHKKC